MRSSASFRVPPPSSKRKNLDQFVLGPFIYQDNTDTADSARASRINKSFVDRSPTPSEVGSPTFGSPDSSSKSSKKSKKSALKKKKTSKASKKSKKERAGELSDEDYPATVKKEIKDRDLRRERSSYEKKKREKIARLAKKADKEQKKLMLQRTRIQEATKEIESSMNMDQETRNRSMDMMKNQPEGMDWRTSRDLKDVMNEIKEWREKTAMSEDLEKRVDKIEKRVKVLEKTNAERKKTIELVDKNWTDFSRLRTQSMALEISQINNRRGAMHRSKIPEDVAKTTAKNLYKLCADLIILTNHLNTKTDLARLADEALTLAEAIAPLYGRKEDFIDSRESTSTTNVSISVGDQSSITTGSAPSSPTKGKQPQTDIPSLVQFDPKYSANPNQLIDAPSLREKSSSYYSDHELNKQAQGNGEQAPVTPQGPTTVIPPAAPEPIAPATVAETTPAPATTEAPVAAPEAPAPPPPEAAPAPPAVAETAAAPSAATSEALPDNTPPPLHPTGLLVTPSSSISLSIDSDKETLVKKKKKGSSRRSSSKSTKEETAKLPE